MILVALLLAASAPNGFGTPVDDDWPPQEYQRTGTLPVTFVPDQESMNKICRATEKMFTVKACSLEGKRHIVLDDPCLPQYHFETFARRACHELAHALGNWPRNHPAPHGRTVKSAEPL